MTTSSEIALPIGCLKERGYSLYGFFYATITKNGSPKKIYPQKKGYGGKKPLLKFNVWKNDSSTPHYRVDIMFKAYPLINLNLDDVIKIKDLEKEKHEITNQIRDVGKRMEQEDSYFKNL